MPSLRAAAARGNDGLPVLAVRNLGHFAIERDGVALPPCTARKALALFRYLLTQRHRAAPKETLMELLWPESTAREAMHSLHVAVSVLRRYLDPPVAGASDRDGDAMGVGVEAAAGASYVRMEGGQYRLAGPAAITDDAARFEALAGAGERHWRAGAAAAAQAAYEEARACYQGDYYVDDPELAWMVAEQERLRARYLVVLDHLGQLLLEQGQVEVAADCYEEVLRRDEYREDAHAQLIQCYARLGRRRAALRQYDRCAAILRELGLAPLPQTQALYRAIASDGVYWSSLPTADVGR
jgi:DNA-binding SARP family transcriptional activator